MSNFARENCDEQLALALASGVNVRKAAKKAGISEATAYRRLQEAEFVQRVRELRREAVDQAVGMMAAATVEAAITLRRLLRAKSQKIQLGAARALLQAGSALREEAELSQRLAELERLLDEKESRP